jgi:hypothetical protein
VPCSTGSCLPVKVVSGAAMCPVASDLVFLIGSAPVSPRVSWLWTPPPCKGGLRCTTCPTTLDPVSLQGRAPERRVSYGSESCLQGLQCHHHMSYCFLWTAGLKHKEKSRGSVCAAWFACFQRICACVRREGHHRPVWACHVFNACKAYRETAIVQHSP